MQGREVEWGDGHREFVRITMSAVRFRGQGVIHHRDSR